jgi:hypothetical protein
VQGLIARAAFAALALAPPQTGFAATTVPLAQRLPGEIDISAARPVRQRRSGERHRRPHGRRLKTGFDPSDKGSITVAILSA